MKIVSFAVEIKLVELFSLLFHIKLVHCTTRGRGNTARTAMDHGVGDAGNGCGGAAPPTPAPEGISRGMEIGLVVNHCCVSSSL